MMLGSGKEIIHFMRATKSPSFGALRRKTPVETFRRRDAPRARHDAHQRQCACGAARQIGVRPRTYPLWLSSPVRELMVEDGSVRGAIVERDGRPVRVLAKRGVILACGGFPHDVARRKAMFPHAPTGNEHWSPGPAGNTGDGLRMAESAGGRVEDTLPQRGGLGAGFDHDAQGRQPGRDAAFHRSRQAWRHRGDARGRALCQ